MDKKEYILIGGGLIAFVAIGYLLYLEEKKIKQSAGNSATGLIDQNQQVEPSYSVPTITVPTVSGSNYQSSPITVSAGNTNDSFLSSLWGSISNKAADSKDNSNNIIAAIENNGGYLNSGNNTPTPVSGPVRGYPITGSPVDIRTSVDTADHIVAPSPVEATSAVNTDGLSKRSLGSELITDRTNSFVLPMVVNE